MTSSPAFHLHRPASRLRVAVIASAVLLILVTAAAVFAPSSGAWVAQLYTDDLPRAWAAGIACAVAVSVAMGLWSVSRMLSCVARGETFSSQAVSHFRRFARWLLLAALMQVVLPLAATVRLASQRHDGAVAVSIDVGDLLAVLLTVVFYFVSRLLVEASRLDEDSRSII